MSGSLIATLPMTQRLTPMLEPLRHDLAIANAAAKLNVQSRFPRNFCDDRTIFLLARARAIQVDDVQVADCSAEKRRDRLQPGRSCILSSGRNRL